MLVFSICYLCPLAFSVNQRCEHYNKDSACDHYVHYLDGSYDLNYLDAYVNEDTDEIDHIEAAALAVGYGPLATCTMVVNSSAQQINCHK